MCQSLCDEKWPDFLKVFLEHFSFSFSFAELHKELDGYYYILYNVPPFLSEKKTYPPCDRLSYQGIHFIKKDSSFYFRFDEKVMQTYTGHMKDIFDRLVLPCNEQNDYTCIIC